MVETILPYFLAGTALFFFWVYGIVSFILDVKHKFIPAATRHWHYRQTDSASDASEDSSVTKTKTDTDSMTSLWRQESGGDSRANYADRTDATTANESTHNRENIDSDESLH